MFAPTIQEKGMRFLGPNIFRALIGEPSKDFRLRLLPGLIQDARQQVEQPSAPAPEEATSIDRAEFAKRYKHVRMTVLVIWALAAICLVQTFRNEFFLFALGAFLTAVLMMIASLQHLHRLFVARAVWRQWGRHDGAPATLRAYIATCVKQPRELLPLALPDVGASK